MEGGDLLTIQELQRILDGGESQTVEFKSWIHAGDARKRTQLAVKELVAFANARGGTLFFGVEDDGTVTGCTDYDTQKLMEGVYDSTRPPLFTECDVVHHSAGDVLTIHVEHDGTTYAAADGCCYKRLGKNSKPFYPAELSHRYSVRQTADFSSRIIVESSLDDIDKLRVYELKEKLRARNPESSMPDMDDQPFLEDLELLREDDGFHLTVAGLLFIGKESSIWRLLPQAEVIYLHYSASNLDEYDARMDMKLPILAVLDRISERIQSANKITNVQVGLFRLEIEDFPMRVIQEALLNALAHRDYQSLASVYVKHYPDHIVIENPGGLMDDITPQNIITHVSVPRNKLIAETLQRLKYVQRTGQGVDIIYRDILSSGKPYPEYVASADAVSLSIFSTMENPEFVWFIAHEQEAMHQNFSLPELMTLRYLKDHPKARISDVASSIQTTKEIAHTSCNHLRQAGLIELSGREYQLSARAYEALKDSIGYVRNSVIPYIKAKEMILEYLTSNGSITNAQTRELCGFTRDQAQATLAKMRKAGLVEMVGNRRFTQYVLVKDS